MTTWDIQSLIGHTFYVRRNGVRIGAACNSYREAQRMLDYWRRQQFTQDDGEAVFRTI